MIVGYLRVSTGRQHPQNQQEEIRRFAASRNIVVERWVVEVASGRKEGRRRKLGALLRRLGQGDTLIVTEISRLSRSLTDLMEIMGRCLERGIALYTTKEGYTFDRSINSKVLCFAFGLVAEIERNLISMRTREALAQRKAAGVKLGRRKGSCTKLNMLLENRGLILRLLDEGHSVTRICGRFGVSRDTFSALRRMDPDVGRAVEKMKERHAARRNWTSEGTLLPLCVEDSSRP